jgi:uncharacterized protein (DUF1501 family)
MVSAGGSTDPDPDPIGAGGLGRRSFEPATAIRSGGPVHQGRGAHHRLHGEPGRFDTHADEKATQETQLGILDTAMAGFLADLATDRYGRNVVVMAYSEFGRRVRANASQGTDHGTAGPVLVAGVPVRGGFYGEQPSLTDLDDGDLKATVDFRTVYQELVTNVLGSDPDVVVPDAPARAQLGFLV